MLMAQILQNESDGLLKMVHNELTKNGVVSAETRQAINWFYNDPATFANTIRRGLRRVGGCSTYYDENGDIRLTATGEYPVTP